MWGKKMKKSETSQPFRYYDRPTVHPTDQPTDIPIDQSAKQPTDRQTGSLGGYTSNDVKYNIHLSFLKVSYMKNTNMKQ